MRRFVDRKRMRILGVRVQEWSIGLRGGFSRLVKSEWNRKIGK